MIGGSLGLSTAAGMLASSFLSHDKKFFLTLFPKIIVVEETDVPESVFFEHVHTGHVCVDDLSRRHVDGLLR